MYVVLKRHIVLFGSGPTLPARESEAFGRAKKFTVMEQNCGLEYESESRYRSKMGCLAGPADRNSLMLGRTLHFTFHLLFFTSVLGAVPVRYQPMPRCRMAYCC